MGILVRYWVNWFKLTRKAITCSNLTIEKLEQGVKFCSKLTIKTPEQRQWRHFSVFIVIFEHISHRVLAFLLITLSR